MMKWVVWIALCLVILGYSCTSIEEKHLDALIHELDIEFVNKLEPNYLVVIPGNGCGSCIQDAIDEIHESEDTAYVFICNSSKEFYLQSGGKQASSFRNLYLDKQKVSIRLNLVQTYPMVYVCKDGKLVSGSPYKSPKRMAFDEKPTTVKLDKPCIDFGKIKFSHSHRESIRITNMGKTPLYIKNIRSSCECTEVNSNRMIIPHLGEEVVHVTFRPDVKGEFERFIFIDCNVKEKVLEIPVRGIVY